MARLRIVLFGSRSRFTERALEHVAQTHEVVALVLPTSRRTPRNALTRFAGLLAPPPLVVRARSLGVAVIHVPAGTPVALGDRLRDLRPDLLCVAIFPRRVPAELIGIAPLGAINVHPSLLPRHRGPLPLFWTYHADDRVAGVTVHHATDRLDSGDIILQEGFELPRGYPVASLDADVARRAAPLLGEAVDALARGAAPRSSQDEKAATQAPLVRQGEPMVAFGEWDVERVWHFLAGLSPAYREPVLDEAGAVVPYRAVAGYRRGAAPGPPGSARRDGAGWVLSCRGGTVQLHR